ncbi:hypothetical protein ACFL2F_04250 [Myxococcota bacterium]
MALALVIGCGEGDHCAITEQSCLDEGSRRCQVNRLQSCLLDQQDCLVWTDTTDCAASGGICEQDGQAAECLPECPNHCTSAGDSRCDGDLVEMCVLDARGCLDWQAADDCTAVNRVCDDSGGSAQCVRNCTDDCLTANQTRCNGTVVQTCTLGADDCFDWLAGTDCAGTARPVCVDINEPAACIGSQCTLPSDCGARGEAVCVSGECTSFNAGTGYGSAVVNLSFHRDLYMSSQSGHLFFFLNETSDGRIIDCDAILSGEVDFTSTAINHLRTDPRLLVFHWEGGKTYFPNNLVQFIRPAQNTLVVAVGYEGSGGQGFIEALGCLADVDIIRDVEIEETVQLNAP